MPVFAFPVTTTSILATGGCLGRSRRGGGGAGVSLRIKLLLLLRRLLLLSLGESLLALGGLACWGR
jgi:hypothetical protein